MPARIAWIVGFASAALISLEHVAQSFVTGAGSCDAGVPVQGDHLLFEQLGGGPLSDKGFQVRLNGAALDSESRNDVPVSNEGHELKLVAAATDTFFRGFLIRIEGEGVDTTDYLDAPDGDDNIRVVSLCVLIEEVGGVSHTNNSEKTEATAILRLPVPDAELAMDVTMVVSSRDGASEWYNSRFILNAGGITVAPTVSRAPSPLPTTSPMPTLSPKPTSGSGSMPTENPPIGGSAAPSLDTDTMQPSVPKELTSSGDSSALCRVAASLVFGVVLTLLV
jgi:hypothetical protein